MEKLTPRKGQIWDCKKWGHAYVTKVLPRSLRPSVELTVTTPGENTIKGDKIVLSLWSFEGGIYTLTGEC